MATKSRSGLTFSEAVTVTGVPQLTLDVGGQNRTAAYSEGSGNAQLVFSYTVAAGDEDTDGFAVVANSLALNDGTIRAGATDAALTHAALQANDHKVDGVAPTVTVGGETTDICAPGPSVQRGLLLQRKGLRHFRLRNNGHQWYCP